MAPEEKTPAQTPESPQKRNSRKGRQPNHAAKETTPEPEAGEPLGHPDDGTTEGAGDGAIPEAIPENAEEAFPREESPLEVSGETGVQPDRTVAPDPPLLGADPQELGRLRQELNDLRDEIRSAHRTLIEQEAELEEFRNLFPDVSLSALPDSVLKDVRRGVPIAAAYALEERRQSRLQKIAAEANAANDLRSSGSAEGESVGFLSPSEVRAMTPEQVRKQYRQILLSMPKWH